MAKILIDTGLKSNIPTLLDGELYFCQDTNELFIGYAGVNTLLNSSATNGKSAYEIWLTQGNIGTETDFLNSLKGIQGDQGLKGDKGDAGIQGIQGIQGLQGLKGDKGDKGEQGIQGSIGNVGPQGIQGIQGPKGDKGDSGVDADMSRVVALENKIGSYTLWVGTKAQYDAISTKDNNTIYFIKG